MYKLNIIEQLYDEIHSPKITPHDLLRNVKLDNYLSIDFKYQDNFLIATSTCLVDKKIATFTYSFQNDKLISLKSIYDGEENEVYNRDEEIQRYYKKAKNLIYSESTAVV